MKEELSEVFNRGFWDGYYQGARLGEWSDVYGSHATRKKIYCGKITNWFDRISVAEVLVESEALRKGDDILIIGETTGVIEQNVSEIRVDLKPTDEAGKGTLCSIPIIFPDDIRTPGGKRSGAETRFTSGGRFKFLSATVTEPAEASSIWSFRQAQ